MRETTLPIYVAVGVAITISFNMMDVGVVAFVSGRHASAAAGVVLAVWGVGSLIGGLIFGAGKRAVDDTAVTRSALAIAVAVGVTALAPGTVGLGVLLFVGGATIAPGLARLYSRVGAVAPAGASTEAFGWIAVGLLAGSSTGAALGGWTVEALGPRADFALAAVAPAVVALGVMAWLRRRDTATVGADPLPS
jgi:predicted MFS family arabinose efflux permease